MKTRGSTPALTSLTTPSSRPRRCYLCSPHWVFRVGGSLVALVRGRLVRWLWVKPSVARGSWPAGTRSIKDVAKWLAVRLLLFLWGEQCLQLCTVNSTDEAKRTHVLIVVHGWFVWDDTHTVGAGYYTNAEKQARKYIRSQHVSMFAVEDVFREALGVPDLRLFSCPSPQRARGTLTRGLSWRSRSVADKLWLSPRVESTGPSQ